MKAAARASGCSAGVLPSHHSPKTSVETRASPYRPAAAQKERNHSRKWKALPSNVLPGDALKVKGVRHVPRVSCTIEAPPKMAPESFSPTLVSVDLGTRGYPIYIAPRLLEHPHLMRKHVKGKQVLIVTNTRVAPLYLDKIVAGLTANGSNDIRVETVILPDGEEYKTLEVLMQVYDKAISTRQDRRCTFVALGGGVVGDMCGYAAASYLRGVNFIQIPTTLMAQVQSGCVSTRLVSG